MSNTELYDTLQINTNASEKEIEKAFRKLSLKYHPDKNPDAKEMFEKISFAKDILTDPRKRAIYDRHGKRGLEALAREGGSEQPQIHEIGCPVTIREYFTQTKTTAQVPTVTSCQECDGSGYTDKINHRCKKCNGQGRSVMRFQVGPGMFAQNLVECSECHGFGYPEQFHSILCMACHGFGKSQKKTPIEVDIPKDIFHTRIITMDGVNICDDEGEIIEAGFLVALKPTPEEEKLFSFHKIYDNDGNAINILMIANIKISLAQALTCDEFYFDHPNGKTYCFVNQQKSDPKHHWIINPSTTYCVEGLGMNDGKLLIKFEIEYPSFIKLADVPVTLENLNVVLGGSWPTCGRFDQKLDLDIYSTDSLDKPKAQRRHHGHHGHHGQQSVQCAHQ
jgi:DnaJ-class molecular chaperone